MRRVSNLLFAMAQPVGTRALRLEVLQRHRSVPHLSRKFYHFLMGMICFSLYAFVLDRTQALMVLGSIGGVLVAFDLIRLRYGAVNDVALRLFGGLMRREELQSISGNSFYVIGLLVAVLFFPKNLVLLSVLFLAIGDPAAAVVGSLYGKHKIVGKKSLEGAIANFVLTGVASFLFAHFYLTLPLTFSLCMFAIGGTVSVIAELFPAPIDDNFSIPVLSVVLLSIVANIISFF